MPSINAIPDTTVGILYCGEMGSAFGKLLRKRGLRVVTTCEGRSRTTAEQAAAAGIEVLPSLDDVVAQSHFVFSLVLPSAALDVAQEYVSRVHLRPEGSVYVEANSIGLEMLRSIESLMAVQKVPLVDATFNGSAHRLEDLGVLHISGPEGQSVASICHGLLRVNPLGPKVGTATLTKLLMSILAKGVAGLVLEVGVLAERAEMLESFLKSFELFYPDLSESAQRMLPTYPRHAERRVGEMRDVEQLGQELQLQLGMTREAGRWIRRVASVDWDETNLKSPADVPTIIKSVEQACLAEELKSPADVLTITKTVQEVRLPEDSRSQNQNKGGITMISQTPKSASLHSGPGFRIRKNFPKLDPLLMSKFQEYEVPDISDSLNRLYALDAAITCQTNKRHRLCGAACTVHVFPGDNLMVHKALDVARPNEIVVIDAHGARGMNAVLGDIVCTKAKHRGIAGFIVDGLVRDMPGIEDLDFPVFARGTTPVGPLHRGPGEINYPISCGGVVVNPGDVIVADVSGIVVVPRDWAEEILQRLEAHKAHQEKYLADVRRGEFSNAWVDELLNRQGCPVYDDEMAPGPLPSPVAVPQPANGNDSPADRPILELIKGA